MRIFGVQLVGINENELHKLLLTLIFIGGILILRFLWIGLARLFTSSHPNGKVLFWIRQITSLVTTLFIFISLLSVWFDDPTRLATAFGLFSAGLAFALQKVVTSFAGYLVILRGKTFNVGDRIVMGGVRGDVISLGLIQTRIMEMGQPPPVQKDDPAMWIQGRQYTGRIVTVTNDKIFEEPVYNYTQEFPFIWEEVLIPITYQTNYQQVENILLESATQCTEDVMKLGIPIQKELERRYAVSISELTPRVFYRITDNWLELSVRFIVREHGIRATKDQMSRLILKSLNKLGIGIASSTYDIVGLPPIRIEGYVPNSMRSKEADTPKVSKINTA